MKRKILAFISVMFCVAGTVMIVLPQKVNAGVYIIFSEDFEGDFPGPQCSVTDENSEYGLDYWGVTSYKHRTGSKSIWCAQAGVNHLNGNLNSKNHYYDESMDAWVDIYIGGLSGYESVTLSFYYWAVTGTTFLSDYTSLWVWCVDTWVEKWKQPNVNSDGWQNVDIDIPTTATYISFHFISDDTVGLGPYEGAYVDDVVLTITENTPPASSVSTLLTYQTTLTFNIPYSAIDNTGGSGVKYVELYYRQGGTGSYSKYGTTYTSTPISFTAPSEGFYEFYTIATDNANNRESAPTSADSSTTVDITKPTLSITTPTSNQWLRSSNVGVTWSSSDDSSGIDYCEVRLDGGSWINTGISTTNTYNNVNDGSHTVSVRVCDKAGNYKESIISFGVDVTKPMVTITSPSSGSTITSSNIDISWSGSDTASGIDHYEIKIDQESYLNVGLDTSHTFTGVSDGSHLLTIKTIDKAGNIKETTINVQVDTSLFSVTGPYSGLVLYLLIFVVIIVVILILWFVVRKKKGKEKEPTLKEVIEKPSEPSPKEQTQEPPSQPESNKR